MSLPMRVCAIVLGLFTMAGCASKEYDTGIDLIISTNRAAANNLIRMAGSQVSPNSNIIVASFADINDLSQSSTFGRVAAQQLTSQFTAAGYSVVEMLLRNSVYISETQGAFLLSREINDISAQHNAHLVLAGTYAVGESNVFVTAKLIRTSDSVIVASHDYALPYTRDMRSLLRDW
jgi:TolB-like protein